MNLLSFNFWRNKYVLVVLCLLLVADIGGIVHAFESHGTRNGVIAIVFPPYGLYSIVESVSHPKKMDVATLAKTDEGRREISKGFTIKPNVWVALLEQIAAQKTQSVSTTINEQGIPYDVTATVQATGPVTLTIQPPDNKNITIAMIDENRDQVPEMLKIVKMVDGKAEVHNTPIDKYSSEDASEFLLAWTLSWATIAQEQQAAAQQVSQ